VAGAPPACDLDGERKLIDALLECIGSGVVASAHDCSEGGLAVALTECCIGQEELPMGAQVDLSAWAALPRRALLFGEAQGRVVVSTASADAVLETARKHGVPAHVIGTVQSASAGLLITVEGKTMRITTDRMSDAWHGALPRAMQKAAAEVVDRDPALAGGTR
jgi:phosphoribosylformylglycinamidine synthase